ncbi:required for meiotic nuclear division protein 1 homolog isoform X2 [Uloborus diversus]|nr:required for meiotic nuclear division protein 1 homolog isoform X2 [Uloborus diversus]
MLKMPVLKFISACSIKALMPCSGIMSKSKRVYLVKKTLPFFSIRHIHIGRICNLESREGVQKSVSALQAKKRVPRKKTLKSEKSTDQETWLTVAYSSAEEYDMKLLSRELERQGLYERLSLPEDAADVIHVCAKYTLGKEEPRHIYFFSEGSVVFWNVPDLEQQSILKFLKPFETNSYDFNLVKEEKEDLEYSYSEKETKFSGGSIVLNSEKETDLYTYAFSNSMALSVKLAMWEAALESYIDSMEWVTENMKCGKEINMSRSHVFKKRGELFALRHVINLSSDLLDTPDFYWDRQELEVLYQQTCNYFNVAKRTKVMNERLSYCSELIDLLGNHMNDKHHVRLEWMIIILIMVEVMFECIHFIEKIIY